MKRTTAVLIVALANLLGSFSTFGQSYTLKRQINWQVTKNNTNSDKEFENFLSFSGSSRQETHPALPLFEEALEMPAMGNLEIRIKDAVFESITGYMDSLDLLTLMNKRSLPVSLEDNAEQVFSGSEIKPVASMSRAAYKPLADIRFVPLRVNPFDGKLEKLLSFTLVINLKPEPAAIYSTKSLYKQGDNSALANGDWFKIGFTETGVYKIDYKFLKSLGLDVDKIRKKQLRIYGKPGGMLPMVNNQKRDTDLVENAIFVSGNGDDMFGGDDYILFYGQSQLKWNYNAKEHKYHHQVNYYADTSYLFITFGTTEGKRISQATTLKNPDRTISKYDDYLVHEVDNWTDVNRSVKSGREWFGENFKTDSSQSFGFDFPNLDLSSPVYLKALVAARSLQTSNFLMTANGAPDKILPLDKTSYDFLSDYAMTKWDSLSFIAKSTHISVGLTFNKAESNALAWLDFIELNARCNLNFNTGSQLKFRDSRSVDSFKVNRFEISNANSKISVWDVTDFHNITNPIQNFGNGQLSVDAPADILHEFIAFDDSYYLQPQNFGRIKNQNLHAIPQPEFVILTHPDFLEAAHKLADFHHKQDGIKVAVVTPQDIYNEFSSGAQDPAAIRDFCRMLYERPLNNPGVDTFRQLLLFGDASYDPKYRVPSNTNFIITYESPNSLSFVASYCSDDYFGFLDPTEGGMTNPYERLDIGIGRLPVRTATQASQMVEKIERYGSDKSMQDWRNILAFAADDEDGNIYLDYTESLVNNIIKPVQPVFNLHKTYIDAYKQENTSTGPRYPAAQAAINKRINAGCLVFTYSGHGGEAGLAHERIMEVDDINTWNNGYAMPLFVTATCELSRFDNPEMTSAGELAILNANGGAIGMLTTTRVVNAGDNNVIVVNVFNKNIFALDKGKPRRMGDIFKETKNATKFNLNTRNFTFLGDPALRLALPADSVVTTSINGLDLKVTPFDTLSPLSLVTVKGNVLKRNGAIDTAFNGTLYPEVFDKERKLITLANDRPESIPSSFYLRENIIYKGKATVTNGRFSFSFVVPRDVSTTNSIGKISYYASTGTTDAAGYNLNIVLGSQSKNSLKDDGKGPEISLFINDTNFKDWGLTNENPVLLAHLNDDLGINTVGNGIGHEITGVLNGGTPIDMNSFYQSEKDNYKKGSLTYPFAGLADGSYNLKLKVWDIANNSTDAVIHFTVMTATDFRMEKLFNYPNPLTENTQFTFEHNSKTDNLTLQLFIYDMQGHLVKTIKQAPLLDDNKLIQDAPTDIHKGVRSRSIDWNGRDDGGGALAPGMYIYKLRVTTEDGQAAENASRLLIVH